MNFVDRQRRVRVSLGKADPDFSVENHGTIYLLRPHTEAANEWVKDNIPEEHQEFAGAIVVEHRYIGAIVIGIQDDGLVVQRD